MRTEIWACKYRSHVGQKRALGPLDLRWCEPPNMGARNHTGVLGKASGLSSRGQVVGDRGKRLLGKRQRGSGALQGRIE